MIRHRKYFQSASQEIEKISKSSAVHSLDEQAVPSYLSSNLLLRYTFNKRLDVVTSHLQKYQASNVLDFGCGLGMLFPFFKDHTQLFYAFDSAPDVLKKAAKVAKSLEIGNVQFINSKEDLRKIPAKSLDAIVALDVLEHVDNLETLLVTFTSLLKDNGRLIVCSPTENFVYRLVRKFAGRGYKGEYHLRAAREVEADLSRYFDLKLVARIYPVLTFFRIVSCTPKK